MPSDPAPSPAPEGHQAFSSRILQGQSRVLSLIAGGAHLNRTLDEFCQVVEGSLPGVRACVSLYEPSEATLRVAAAPSLPASLRSELDGLSVGLAPGACSAAVHRNEIVITSDIASDPLWEGMREPALEAGLRSCWSAPIRSVRWAGGPGEEDEVRILGTVALYHPEARQPAGDDLETLEIASALAALALITSRTHEKLGEQQLYDPLTGLPNRRLFTEELKEAVAGMSPHEDKLGVLLVDIDHFKEVNDTFGYAVGDFLLRSVGERFIESRKSNDLVARFGDDEFIFLVRDPATSEEVKQAATAILGAVGEPYDFGGQQLAITASLGASLYPWDGEDAQTLMRNAENALHTAKRQGRNRFRLYAPTMGANAFEKLQLKMALTYAAENDEMELLYQPKIHSQSGEVVGVEALVYWNHPSQGRLSPGHFIPLAEETGIILPLGNWVLRTACEQARELRRGGFRDFTIAVNISALQFRERTFVDTVASILEQTRLEPEALELEVTETVAMTEVQKTMERLTALQALGLRISIDDFGTGYSSLAYLKRFPIHTLKIDRSFVANLPADKENKAIIKAVIALAHYLDLNLVAEGVETREQADYLRREGCKYLQGYYFSTPVAGRRLRELLESGVGSEPGRSYLAVGNIA